MHSDAHICRCSDAAVYTLLLPSLIPPPHGGTVAHTGNQSCFYSQRQTSVRAMVHAWFSLYREEARGSSVASLISLVCMPCVEGPRPVPSLVGNPREQPPASHSLAKAAEPQEGPHHSRSACQSSDVSANRCKYSYELAWAPQGTDTGASARARNS